MLDEALRQALALEIERQAGTYLTVRGTLFTLEKELFTRLAEVRNGSYTEAESHVEQGALLQVDLSESLFNNVYNGQIAAAYALFAWQESHLADTLALCFGEPTGGSDANSAARYELLLAELEASQTMGGIRTSPESRLADWNALRRTVRAVATTGPAGTTSLSRLAYATELTDILRGQLWRLLVADADITRTWSALAVDLLSRAVNYERSVAAPFIEGWRSASGALDQFTFEIAASNRIFP